MKWLFRLGQDFKRLLARPLVRRLLGALILLWLFDRALYFATESHWHHAAGFGAAWQARIIVQLLLFGITFVITWVFGLLLKPLLVLPADPPQLPPFYKWVERRLRVLMVFDGRVVACLLLGAALWSGKMAAAHWPQWLLFWHGGNWGYTAPWWPRDVSWWIFKLPLYQLLLDVLWRALSLVFFCGLLISLGRGAARFLSRRPALSPRALQSLALLGIALLLVRAARFALMPLDETTSFFDAALWNGRRPAWWLSALFQIWPLALLILFLIKRVLPTRAFALSLATALIAPPFLLGTFSRTAPLFGNNADYRAASQAATRQAWGLNDVKIERWQPLNASRTPPQNSEWLKRLQFSENGTVSEESGPLIPLYSPLWRFLWAWRERDLSLMRGPSSFSPRRSLQEQREALVPFLLPGNAARRVEVGGQVFHLQELLAATDAFPGASSEVMEVDGQAKTINSAHAAVLLVQQMPGGSIKFYGLQESSDALTRAWQKALPDLILPFASMPQALRNQRRYPAELLKRQAHQLSEVTNSSWHAAQQRDASGWLQTQESVFAFLPTDEGFAFMAQSAMCSDTSGQTLAALLQARCDKEFGQLSLLHFESEKGSLAGLDSGLSGPDILAERLEAALPQEIEESFFDARQEGGARWTSGTVLPVAINNQVWLWQPLFHQKENTKVLTGHAVLNAAWRDGPIGVGHTSQAALDNWIRLAQKWQSSSDLQQDQSLTSRLRVLLQPNRVQNEAEIARLIELAARLHQASKKAENTDPEAAQLLRAKQGDILQKLQVLMPVEPKTEP